MIRKLPILLTALVTTTLLLSCEKEEAAPTNATTIYTADSISGMRTFTGTTVVTYLDSPGKVEYYNDTVTMTIEKRVGITVRILNTAASPEQTLKKKRIKPFNLETRKHNLLAGTITNLLLVYLANATDYTTIALPINAFIISSNT